MKKIIFSIFVFPLVTFVSSAQVSIQNLLTENRTNPIGLDVAQPRFSWQLITSKRNVMQSAYEIKVSDGTKTENTVWQSGKRNSDSSVQVSYKGIALESGKKYNWQVL